MGDIETIQKIINSRDLSKFVGFKESFYLEAKNKNPYDFKSPNGRYELAKDITAFANNQGGFLILGLKTEQLIEENTDKVSELDLFLQEEFDINTYLGIAKENIFPKIDDLRIDWIEDIKTTKEGIAYIFIPPQKESKKYFVIKNVFEDGEKIRNIVFGIVKRNGADSIPLNIQEIYECLQKGKNSISQRLSSIDEKIDLLSASSQKKVQSIIKSSTYNDKDKIEEILKAYHQTE